MTITSAYYTSSFVCFLRHYYTRVALLFVKDGLTPLHIAARSGNAAIVTALVQGGAAVNAVNKVKI